MLRAAAEGARLAEDTRRSRMRTKRAVVGVLAAGALAVGVVVPALAQDDAGSGDTATTTEDTFRADRAERRAAHQEAFAAALADELGLPVDEVTAAIEKVTEQHRAEMRTSRTERLRERLDAAVEAGELTQEEADELMERHEAGEFPLRGRDGTGIGPRMGGGPGMHGGSGPGGGFRGEDGRPGHGAGRGAHGGMGGPAMLDG
jgi:hypothetical protein